MNANGLARSSRFLRRLLLLCFSPWATAQLPVAIDGRESALQAIRGYEAQEDALSTEIEPQLARARDNLSDDLRTFATKLNTAKKGGEAAAVQTELERFNKSGIAPDKSKNGTVRAFALAYLRAVDAANETVALKRKSIRTRFMQTMITAERAARARNDMETVNAARLAEQSLAIRDAINDPARIASTRIVGRDRNPVRDLPRKGMPLIGFRGNTGGWFQFTVLGSLRPLFLSPSGAIPGGTKHGHADEGREIIAREGYAVGAILVRSGEVIDGLQVVFMRMKPDGLSLDPQDFYVSDWLGKEGGGAQELSGKGKLIIGMTATSNDVVESLGLVYLK